MYLKPLFNILTSALVLCFAGCSPAHKASKANRLSPYEYLDTLTNKKFIRKDLFEHTLLNNKLIEEVVKYSRRYALRYPDLAIEIDLCYYTKDSIVYNIGFVNTVDPRYPIILLEPIDGRKAILSLSILKKEVDLNYYYKKIEVLREYYSNDWYEKYARNRDNIQVKDDGLTIIPYSGSFNDEVTWNLVFDGDGNLIRKYKIGLGNKIKAVDGPPF